MLANEAAETSGPASETDVSGADANPGLNRRASVRLAQKKTGSQTSASLAASAPASAVPSASEGEEPGLELQAPARVSSAATRITQRSRANTRADESEPTLEIAEAVSHGLGTSQYGCLRVTVANQAARQEHAGVRLDIARHERNARKLDLQAKKELGMKLAAEAKLNEIAQSFIQADLHKSRRLVSHRKAILDKRHRDLAAVAGSDDVDYDPRLNDSSDTEDMAVAGPATGRYVYRHRGSD